MKNEINTDNKKLDFQHLHNIAVESLWNRFEPLISIKKPNSVGRPPASPKIIFFAIIKVLKTGMQWREINKHNDGVHCSTVYNYFKNWKDKFCKLYILITREIIANKKADLTELKIDASYVRSKQGIKHVGKSPVDRGKNGLKQHIVTDKNRFILNYKITPANLSDTTQLIPLIIKMINNLKLNFKKNYKSILSADRGYSSKKNRFFINLIGLKDAIIKRKLSKLKLKKFNNEEVKNNEEVVKDFEKIKEKNKEISKRNEEIDQKNIKIKENNKKIRENGSRHTIETNFSWINNIYRRLSFCWEKTYSSYNSFFQLAICIINVKHMKTVK